MRKYCLLGQKVTKQPFPWKLDLTRIFLSTCIIMYIHSFKYVGFTMHVHDTCLFESLGAYFSRKCMIEHDSSFSFNLLENHNNTSKSFLFYVIFYSH